MPEPRRLKALQTILRSSQYDIDQISSQLAQIRQQEAQILAELSALNIRRDRESYSPVLEAQPFVTAFLEALGREEKHLKRRLSELEHVSSELEGKVRELFLERQRWTTTYKRLQASHAYAEQRFEEKHLDEISSVRYVFASRTS